MPSSDRCLCGGGWSFLELDGRGEDWTCLRVVDAGMERSIGGSGFLDVEREKGKGKLGCSLVGGGDVDVVLCVRVSVGDSGGEVMLVLCDLVLEARCFMSGLSGAVVGLELILLALIEGMEKDG